MKPAQLLSVTAALAGLLATSAVTPALAQAPPTAPLVLTLPSSARVAALGGAWVAGRDQDVIFSNPAQLIGVRTDFSMSIARVGDDGHMASLNSVYTAGKLGFTLGWGLQVVNFAAPSGTASPFSTDVIRRPGSAQLLRPTIDAQSAVAVVGGAILYKGFRIGASGKYAADRVIHNQHALLADVGVARNLWGGTAAVSFQNLGLTTLGDLGVARIPRQIAGGYSKTTSAGPLDLAFFTQVSYRRGWSAAAAGLEAGYSWIEGYAVTGRVGVRRPETHSEHPISLGGAFTADRLTLEYALQMFDNSQRTHLVTIRWR